MKSMTGFGSSIEKINGIKYRITIKSINDKFLRVKCKIPEDFSEYLSYKIEKIIPDFIEKGGIYIKIVKIDKEQSITDFDAIKEKLAQYLDFFKQVSAERSFSLNVSINDLLSIESRLDSPIMELEDEESIKTVLQKVKKVLKLLIIERQREGDNLEEFFIKSINQIEVSLSTVELSIPKYLEKIKKHVDDKLNEIYKYDTSLNKFNEDKIIKEISYYYDKSDITEEIVRLKSHLNKYHQMLSIRDEPIGNSMMFTIQEMQREISTISAKYNNPEVFSDILKIKNEIQKCKEQARNVE